MCQLYEAATLSDVSQFINFMYSIYVYHQLKMSKQVRFSDWPVVYIIQTPPKIVLNSYISPTEFFFSYLAFCLLHEYTKYYMACILNTHNIILSAFQVVDRRVKLMEDEGIKFITGVDIGKDKQGSELTKEYDATVLSMGAAWPRDLPIPGMFNCYITQLPYKYEYGVEIGMKPIQKNKNVHVVSIIKMGMMGKHLSL